MRRKVEYEILIFVNNTIPSPTKGTRDKACLRESSTIIHYLLLNIIVEFIRQFSDQLVTNSCTPSALRFYANKI